jgi:hypothetical protein
MRGKAGAIAPAGVNKRKRDEEPADSVLNRLVKRVIVSISSIEVGIILQTLTLLLRTHQLFNSPQQTNSLESPSSTAGGQLPSPLGGSSVVSRAIAADSMMSSNFDISSANNGMGDDWSIEQSLADDLFNYEDPAVYQILQYTLNADGLNLDSMQGMAPPNMDPFSWNNNGGYDLFGGGVGNSGGGTGTGTGQGW